MIRSNDCLQNTTDKSAVQEVGKEKAQAVSSIPPAWFSLFPNDLHYSLMPFLSKTENELLFYAIRSALSIYFIFLSHGLGS